MTVSNNLCHGIIRKCGQNGNRETLSPVYHKAQTEFGKDSGKLFSQMLCPVTPHFIDTSIRTLPTTVTVFHLFHLALTVLLPFLYQIVFKFNSTTILWSCKLSFPQQIFALSSVILLILILLPAASAADIYDSPFRHGNYLCRKGLSRFTPVLKSPSKAPSTWEYQSAWEYVRSSLHPAPLFCPRQKHWQS